MNHQVARQANPSLYLQQVKLEVLSQHCKERQFIFVLYMLICAYNIGNQELPADAAKLLNTLTPSSTLLRKKKAKLHAQPAASHNTTRRVKKNEREKAHSRQHTRESRKGIKLQ